MPIEVIERHFAEPLAERLRAPRVDSDVVVHWLGQAGFVVSDASHRVLIDPYLSDTLAEKYRGSATPHDRLMAAPVGVAELGPLDLVLITHHHTDHMDPGTLAPLAARQPSLPFLVPKASRTEAMRRAEVSANRLVLMDAGQTVRLSPGLSATAVHAAHETLEQDRDGHVRFLGYALTFGDSGTRTITLLHSGDTVSYAGQVEEITRLRPDVLMLPVNGRSAALAALGVPGNLTLDEAVQLTVSTGAAVMIAHHHGMFAFNTVPLGRIEAAAAEPGLPFRLIPAREGLEVRVRVT